MGFSLKDGRFLTADDSIRSGRVCVVDEDFARYYWPNAGALGQRLFAGSAAGPDSQAFTVVGVVGSVKQAGLTDAGCPGRRLLPVCPAWRRYSVRGRPHRPPAGLARARAAEDRPPDRPRTARQRPSLHGPPHRREPPAAAFAGDAGRRLFRNCRAAHGHRHLWSIELRRVPAPPRDRRAHGPGAPGPVRSAASFWRSRLRLLAAGIALGIAGAWLTGHAMQTLLFQVQPLHIATLAAATAVIAVVSLAACLLPSHRAARISPIEALADR